MSRTIKFAKAGGPEVLEFVEVKVPAPGPNEYASRSRRSASTAPKPCGGSTTTFEPVKFPAGLGYEAACGHRRCCRQGRERFRGR
jgi:NADPH:quinone reductase-like Zn-dependent oxidoreductase